MYFNLIYGIIRKNIALAWTGNLKVDTFYKLWRQEMRASSDPPPDGFLNFSQQGETLLFLVKMRFIPEKVAKAAKTVFSRGWRR